jgi:hypothetical protein
MKYVKDLTDAELVTLTEAQLDNLIDLECAERGIPMLPPEPLLADEEPLEFDSTAYVVGHFEFRERADAEAVVELINSKPRAKYNYVGSPFYESEFAGWTFEERAAFTEKPIMSAVQRLATKAERVKRKNEKEEYDRRRESYTKILNQREEVGEEVRERYWQALRTQRDRTQCREQFEHYLRIAEGNRSIAFRFFEKSYGHQLVQYPELRDEFMPPTEQAEEVAAA